MRLRYQLEAATLYQAFYSFGTWSGSKLVWQHEQVNVYEQQPPVRVVMGLFETETGSLVDSKIDSRFPTVTTNQHTVKVGWRYQLEGEERVVVTTRTGTIYAGSTPQIVWGQERYVAGNPDDSVDTMIQSNQIEVKVPSGTIAQGAFDPCLWDGKGRTYIGYHQNNNTNVAETFPPRFSPDGYIWQEAATDFLSSSNTQVALQRFVHGDSNASYSIALWVGKSLLPPIFMGCYAAVAETPIPALQMTQWTTISADAAGLTFVEIARITMEVSAVVVKRNPDGTTTNIIRLAGAVLPRLFLDVDWHVAITQEDYDASSSHLSTTYVNLEGLYRILAVGEILTGTLGSPSEFTMDLLQVESTAFTGGGSLSSVSVGEKVSIRIYSEYNSSTQPSVILGDSDDVYFAWFQLNRFGQSDWEGAKVDLCCRKGKIRKSFKFGP